MSSKCRLNRWLADKQALPAVVGIDIAKQESLSVVRWQSGEFERPWRTKTPEEVPILVDRLRDLAKDRPLVIAMESTGTYGDALRQALTDAGLVVHRVSGKAVPQHDGKDAAIVAELAALGKSSPWPYRPPTEFDQELRYWVEQTDIPQRIGMLWLGRLEALLARHWPEATTYLELNSETLLQVLAQYGGPAPLAADADAAKRLKSWGGHFLKQEKIERFVETAARSVGVRQTALDRRRMQVARRGRSCGQTRGAGGVDDLEESGLQPRDDCPPSGGGGLGDGLCIVGPSGRSGELPLRRGIPQSNGAEPQGTQQRAL